MIPVNVMAPTMQVACKAFIAPNSAARSPKERYTRVPRSLKASPPPRCILVECPKRGDGQDWDGSHLLELLSKCDILIAARDCQGSWPRHPAHDARTRGRNHRVTRHFAFGSFTSFPLSRRVPFAPRADIRPMPAFMSTRP